MRCGDLITARTIGHIFYFIIIIHHIISYNTLLYPIQTIEHYIGLLLNATRQATYVMLIAPDLIGQ